MPGLPPILACVSKCETPFPVVTAEAMLGYTKGIVGNDQLEAKAKAKAKEKANITTLVE